MKKNYPLLAFFLLLSLTQGKAQIPTNGLIAAWTFTGSAADVSGNGHHGTVSGATPATDRFGVHNRAYSFDGYNDYIRIPHDTALNIRRTFTISVWVRVCRNSSRWNFDLVIGKPKGGDQSGSQGYGLTATSTYFGFEGLRFFYLDIDQGWGVTSGYFEFESWHHVVLTGDPNPPSGSLNNEIWLDGKKVTSMASPNGWGWTYNLNDLMIGGDPDSVWRAFRGDIDDIRMYDRVLSGAEIRNLYFDGGWPLAEGEHPHKPSISLIPLGDTVICKGEEVPVRVVNNGAEVNWRYATYVRKSGDTVWLSPPATVTFRATTMNRLASACPDTATDWADLTVIVRDPVEINLGPPIYVCSGVTRQLAAQTIGGTPPYRWEWTPGTGLNDSTVQHPELTTDATSRYQVVVTDSYGCRDTATISINILKGPEVDLGGDTLRFCHTDPPTMLSPQITGGNPPYIVSWEGSDVANDTTEEMVVNPTEPTRYIVTVTDVLDCFSRDTIMLVPMENPEIDAGFDRVFCPGESLQIGGSVEPGLEYRWSPEVGLSDPTSATPTVSGLDRSMTYVLEATDRSTGCRGVDSIRLEIQDVALAFTTDVLDFGKLDGCTSSRSMTATLTNGGTTPATLSDLETPDSPFRVVSPTGVVTVPAGGSVDITILFAPSNSGEFADTLFATGPGCNTTAELQLNGERGEILFSLDRTDLAFGEVSGTSGSGIDSVIVLRNEGTVELLIGSVQIDEPFVHISPALPALVQPGDSIELLVRFAPKIEGTFSTTMRIAFSSGPCSDTLRAELSGSKSTSGVIEEDGDHAPALELDLTMVPGLILHPSGTHIIRAVNLSSVCYSCVSLIHHFPSPVQFTGTCDKQSPCRTYGHSTTPERTVSYLRRTFSGALPPQPDQVTGLHD